MSSPPDRGHIRLYSAMRPGLLAGRYRLELDQELEIPETRALEGHVQELEVVAPRYRMSGTELYSLFPPPNAEGPFTNRFAQAVLKRRTLPWERRAGSNRKTPWMALVVLAEGEGTYRTDISLDSDDLADYRAGIELDLATARQAGNCDVLQVTGRVVRKSFPAVEDLPYLTHVREVNLLDSEDANLLDDDGFVAVVASSRVLRGGQAYGAYLISLEGQIEALPRPADPVENIGPARIPPAPFTWLPDGSDLREVSAADAAVPFGVGGRLDVSGISTGVPRREWVEERFAGWDDDETEERLIGLDRVASAGWELVVDDDDTGPSSESEPFVVGDTDLYRFPVLAHWSFRTIHNGDFESLMRNLDVGLLGTVDDAAESPPTVLATGHLLLERQARSGERVGSWYRGPFVPQELDDRDDVPLHAAEQAVRIGRDGIEDLSYAAAFELGRLLALADPSFVTALIGWRRRGSTRSWGRLKRHEVVLDLIPPLELERLGRFIALGAVERLLTAGDGSLDPLGPLVQPVPLRETYDMARDAATLRAIGMEATVVADALGMAEEPSGFGSGILDPGGLVDTGAFEGVLADTSLGEALATELAAVWRREAGRIADMEPGT